MSGIINERINELRLILQHLRSMALDWYDTSEKLVKEREYLKLQVINLESQLASTNESLRKEIALTSEWQEKYKNVLEKNKGREIYFERLKDENSKLLKEKKENEEYYKSSLDSLRKNNNMLDFLNRVESLKNLIQKNDEREDKLKSAEENIKVREKHLEYNEKSLEDKINAVLEREDKCKKREKSCELKEVSLDSRENELKNNIDEYKKKQESLNAQENDLQSKIKEFEDHKKDINLSYSARESSLKKQQEALDLNKKKYEDERRMFEQEKKEFENKKEISAKNYMSRSSKDSIDPRINVLSKTNEQHSISLNNFDTNREESGECTNELVNSNDLKNHSMTNEHDLSSTDKSINSLESIKQIKRESLGGSTLDSPPEYKKTEEKKKTCPNDCNLNQESKLKMERKENQDKNSELFSANTINGRTQSGDKLYN
ncbi:MAG: hypothetical protein IJU76_15305 [Desulfovibrionaceae bacterium]|nr:hypothetical protein [Desulfovibrionaceae bacterium]